MIEKVVLNKEILEILKRHRIIAYKLYKEELTNNKEGKEISQGIKKLALNMYLNSLEENEKSTIKKINKAINTTKKGIQYNLLATFYETYATDIAQTFYNDILTNQAKIIVYRDNYGFYGINDDIQKELDNCSLELDVLNNQIHNKETLMSGNRAIRKNTLCRREVLLLSYFLGYGKAREEILNKQNRNKVLKKNKD